jgi:mRNA-degrading endonuclease RelE of RelBE toxin-antitoxin system
MNYTITPTPEFIRQAKVLAKKNRRIGDDLVKLKEVLIDNPHAGTAIGNNCFKLRIGNSSNSKGKSSGYRVITYCLDENKIIRLLLIYAKNERESVSDMEIIEVLKNNGLM